MALPYAANYINQQNWDQLQNVSGGDTSSINAAVQQFQQAMQNLTGRQPTTQEINDFAQNALMSAEQAPGNLGYSDTSSLVNNYIQQAFGPQVAQNQQSQQASQLDKTQQMIQNLIGKQTAATTSQLTDPNSPTYQQYAGMMNNMGITPSSGAFSAGIGGQIGQAGAAAENAALGGVSLPAISGIQGMNQQPFQFAQGNSDLSHLSGLSDFQLQSDLARQLQEMGQPSTAQSILGMASGSAQGAGSLLQGGSAAYKATSYVCKELIKRGLLCDSDMDDFHFHIMPAMFKKGRAFWKYAMDGLKLVNAVNKKGLDWRAFKPLLFNRVMDEPDPCKAVDLYADACHQLCISSDRSLWDPKVYRTGIWDSLIFLPRLFCYPPFLDALEKCIRRKLAIVYDKPRCGVHR